MKLHSINVEQRAYVMPSGKGTSCYGWDVLDTASPADAREVIRRIGWDQLDDFFDGEENDKFRAKFPRAKFAAAGSTGAGAGGPAVEAIA